MAIVPTSISNQVLVDMLKAELWNASVLVQNMFAEMVKHWSAASMLVMLAAATSLAVVPGVGIKLSATGIRLEKLENFASAPAELENWLFNVGQFCEVHGITDCIEMVKFVLTLLRK